MTASGAFLDFAIHFSLLILVVAFVVTIVRIVIGPTLPDRILALDMLVAIGIGFIAVMGIKTQYYLYVDIAIALGLVGFLATVAFARFVLSKATTYGSDESPNERGSDQAPKALPTKDLSQIDSPVETREPVK